MAARRGKSQARRNSSNGTPAWVWLVAGAAIAAVVFLAAPNLFKKDGDGFLRVGPQPNPDAQPAPVGDADIDAGAEAPKPATASAKPEEKPATQYDFYTLLPGTEVQMSDAELAASARAEEQRRAAVARAAAAATPPTEAQRAQAALEGRPVPATVAALPAPVSEAARQPAPVSEATPTRPATTTPAAAPVASAQTAAKPAAQTPPAAVAAAPADNVRYILQAGAFGASGDAEATKAKLAMMGLAARVESAQINGNTVYRVRMGPYGTASELAEAKSKLDGSGLQAMAMAIKAQ